MTTGSVSVGRADSGAIVWTPVPGMLKVIVCTPGVALASVMTWRSEPVPVSLVLVTTKLRPEKLNASENSDVLPDGSVAVSAIDCPAVSTNG